MKYPYIIFYRLEEYSDIDTFFSSNDEKLNCSLFFTSNKDDLNKLFNSSYQLLVTYGPNQETYIENTLPFITDRMRARWIHYDKLPTIEVFNQSVNYCFIHNCYLDRTLVRPVFSIFSSTFKSYEKILRAYNSLKAQTFKDWEWVIMEDSDDNDEHFQYLRQNLMDDSRIRLYRRGENSGNIGNVKNEAVSLCRGLYVLELDDDDEILPDVLADSVKIFEEQSDIGFIYMDFINIHEDGRNFTYGDFLCKGYACYYCQKYNGKWVNVYNTPNINNITLSHLVCCPNHPRIWRKETLLRIGNYSEFLPICDDYEIILRTALHTKIAKIPKLGYVQYMNDSNNNFSLIRNSEINRIGPQFIQPIFYDKFHVNDKMRELDAYEDEKYIDHHSKIWERSVDEYQHQFCNSVHNVNYDKQYCIIGIDSLIYYMDKIKELYEDERNDFILLDNKSTIDYLWFKLDYYGLDRFKCYTLIDSSVEVLTNYFMMMYKSCDNFEIITPLVNKPPYNTPFHERFVVINSLTSPSDSYLEIGVENGVTFNNVHFEKKEGVDPDPICVDQRIISKTSDDYFHDIIIASPEDDIDEQYIKDVVFIDGLHQSEYVLNDINNSIVALSQGGKIFMDDILPLTYDEQLKIPKKHYYEKNILKYGEPWTGDVWKVLYYILKNYSEHIEFSYYYHLHYRGVGLLKIKSFFQIDKNAIDAINGFDYFTDFNDYVALLGSASVNASDNIIIEI